jgi:uncharacterized protein YndB with AHSA1/START domain
METQDAEVRISKFIGADRQAVFAAWTEADLIRKWFAPGAMAVSHAATDPREGGAYAITMRDDDGDTETASGTYREVVPGRKLVFTWGWQRAPHEETLVTVEFADQGQGTLVTVTHARFRTAEQAGRHAQGWEGCLANLAARIAMF